eukprot:9466135-Pyramimonas_sp.AAC.1
MLCRCWPKLFPYPKQKGVILGSHIITNLGQYLHNVWPQNAVITKAARNWATEVQFGARPDYEAHGLSNMPEEFDKFYSSELQKIRAFLKSKGSSIRLCLIWKGYPIQNFTEKGVTYTTHNEVYESFITGAKTLGLDLVVIDEMLLRSAVQPGRPTVPTTARSVVAHAHQKCADQGERHRMRAAMSTRRFAPHLDGLPPPPIKGPLPHTAGARRTAPVTLSSQGPSYITGVPLTSQGPLPHTAGPRRTAPVTCTPLSGLRHWPTVWRLQRPAASDRYYQNGTIHAWMHLFSTIKCDLPVMWALDGSVVEAQRRRKGHFLLMETPYYAP